LTVGFPGAGLSLAAVNTEKAPPEVGGLSVRSEPDGATVYVDGEAKGMTPLRLDGVLAGDHRVTLVKEGFLENSRVLNLEKDQTRAVNVKLTPASEATRHTIQIRPEGEEEEGEGLGGSDWLHYALGGGAAAVFAALLIGDNIAPEVVRAIDVSPTGIGLESVTNFTFTSTASDRDNDPLTYSWDFGDNSTGSGSSASKTYTAAGTYRVRVTVSDGKDQVTTYSFVTVKSLTGTWVGDVGGRSTNSCTFNITQLGNRLTGEYSDTVHGQGTMTGSVSAPLNVSMQNTIPAFRTGSWTGSLDSISLDRIDGTVDWLSGRPQSFFLDRR